MQLAAKFSHIKVICVDSEIASRDGSKEKQGVILDDRKEREHNNKSWNYWGIKTKDGC